MFPLGDEDNITLLCSRFWEIFEVSSIVLFVGLYELALAWLLVNRFKAAMVAASLCGCLRTVSH